MGRCLGFFANALGEYNAIKAKLIALKRGLLLAQDLEVKRLDIRMDNMACTQIMNNEETHYGPNLQLVK
ncbi:RNA-directed RNA polymerase [Bienertia sinuspersici]